MRICHYSFKALLPAPLYGIFRPLYGIFILQGAHKKRQNRKGFAAFCFLEFV